MGILRVSNSFNFEKKIKSFCQPPRYDLGILENRLAFIAVHPHESEKIGKHILLIRDLDDIVRFSMPSQFTIPSAERVPHPLSTMLLQINSASLMGFWSLQVVDGDGDEEDEEDNFIFTYDNNVPKILLNKNMFDEVIADMLENCETLYQLIEKAEQYIEKKDENEPTSPGTDSEHQ